MSEHAHARGRRGKTPQAARIIARLEIDGKPFSRPALRSVPMPTRMASEGERLARQGLAVLERNVSHIPAECRAEIGRRCRAIADELD